PSPLPPLPSSSHTRHPSRQPSANSLARPRSPISPSQRQQVFSFSPRSMRTPLPPATFITATRDHETYSYVDLSNCTSPAALRETVLTKLQIRDDDFRFCDFFQTKIGGSKGGGPPPERHIKDDEELWDACWRAGESGYTVSVKMRHQPQQDNLPAGASAATGGRVGYSVGIPSPNPGQGGSTSLSRRQKSESISSRSDLSSPFSPGDYVGGAGRTSPLMNEFGEIASGQHGGNSAGSRGERGPAWSYPRAGEGHRATGSYGSSSAGGGGLSPPIDRARGNNNVTPTPQHPEEYVWVDDPRRGEVRRRPSNQQLQQMQMSGAAPSQPPQGSHGVVMHPTGPVRRLPGPPQPPPLQQPYPSNDYEHLERRQRTQTAPGSVVSPQIPQGAAGWSRPPSAHYSQPPPQPVRPLPPTSAGHPPPFNIVTTPQSQYHNLALQDRDAFRSHHPSPNSPHQPPYFAPPPPSLGPPRHVMVTKSADNLREHYAQAFDSNLRPKPPPHPVAPTIPPQYRNGPAGPPRPPATYPQASPSQQYPTQVPPQPQYGAHSRGPSQPRQAPPPPIQPQSQHPVNSSREQPYRFDISVMRPAGPSSTTSLPVGKHALPLKSARPSTSSGAFSSPTTAQSPHGGWQPQQQQSNGSPGPPLMRRGATDTATMRSPHTQDRSHGQSSRFPTAPPLAPDLSGKIPLHPGEILQHLPHSRPLVVHPHRESYSPTSPTFNQNAPPPTAIHMASNDPSWGVEEMRRSLPNSNSSAYGVEATPRRDPSAGAGIKRNSEGSRDRRESREEVQVPRSLQPGAIERDSGSSSGSSGWKRGQHAPPPPTTTQEASAYDGLQDDPPMYNSPPSSASARSSTSASGPITPVSVHVAPQMSAGEWARKTALQQSPSLVPIPLPGRQESDVTVNGSEHDHWATLMSKAFEGDADGESTLTSEETGTLKAAASLRSVSAASSVPTTPELSTPPMPQFSPYDEDDDDEEESATYLPGFGPSRTPLSPIAQSSPIGFTLVDQPVSRSPAFERRPTLPRLTIDPSSRASSGLPDAPSSSTDVKSADSERSGGHLRRSFPSSTSRRQPTKTPSDESPIVRRGSFADREVKDWAFRPKVEDVLENLEVFFPKHELDKEVFDAPVPTPATPSPTTSPAKDTQPTPAPLKRGATGLGYKKSIRVVAGDRKRNMLKASAREKQPSGMTSANVMRRKSTKLFGSRLEEVTPAQMKHMDVDAIPEAADEDPANFSFKWIKGELIGRGSYGKVYIAFNVTAGEAIAVKQVELPKTASDKEDARQQGMVASLKAEIELLKDLSHDNIVEYLGMEETPEHLSIFLEYVPGGSVGRMIRTHGKFPEDVIVHFTFQILTGLQYLHNLGILHRDLKGDNILCDQDGVCKISDFGTSKKSQDIYNNDANMSMQGSIFWMAPEVIKNDQRGYSAKADIWSLGCLCLEMFAGRRPWDQKEMFEAMFKLGAERLAPPVPEDVILSDLAKAFFNACFQPEPDNRPRADQLMRHRFLELGPDYAFTKTSLYRAIASNKDHAVHTPSP
ncbi:hypothetical protein P7C70_g3901, partial [Phenoliferia sp. Uapishka_3]